MEGRLLAARYQRQVGAGKFKSLYSLPAQVQFFNSLARMQSGIARRWRDDWQKACLAGTINAAGAPNEWSVKLSR